MAFLMGSVGLTLTLTEEATGRTDEFCYPKGLKDFISYINGSKAAIHPEVLSFTGHGEDANGNPVTGAHIEASGGMPAHDHGLPTYPRVTDDLGSGDYRLDGMRFHMTGAWEITIAVDADGKTDTVVVTVTL